MNYNTIEVYPTNVCQYACIGCALHKCTDEWTAEQTIRMFESGLFTRVDEEVTILGGEPTLWRYLLTFIQTLREENKKIKISITTNGLRLLEDKTFANAFYNYCIRNKAIVHLSYHNNMDVVIPVAKELYRRELLGNIIFIPNTPTLYDEMLSDYKKLNLAFHNCCTWRPFITNTPRTNPISKLSMRFLEKLSPKEIQSYYRMIDKKQGYNLDCIRRGTNQKRSTSFYSDYQCKCGQNGVLFTDRKLYHCLSSAIAGGDIVPYESECKRLWFPCKNRYCYCDTFELQSREFIMREAEQKKESAMKDAVKNKTLKKAVEI